jgi:serine/threonine protein kinase
MVNGGQGLVVKGFCVRDDSEIAIKMCPIETGQSLKDEAVNLRRMSHPNVVTLLDEGTGEVVLPSGLSLCVCFIVLPYFPHQSLDLVIKHRNLPFSEIQAQEIIR